MDEKSIAVKIAEIDQRSKSNSHRIDELEDGQKTLTRLATSIEVMATKQEVMNTTLTKLDGKVEQLEQKPGKKWDGLVEKAVWAIVAAAIAYALAQIGL